MRAAMKLSVPKEAIAEVTITAPIGDFMVFLKEMERLKKDAREEWFTWPISEIVNIIDDVVKAATKETHIYTEQQAKGS